jgi:hypothetical protein
MKSQDLRTKLTFFNPVKAECFDKDGNLKWTREFQNGVVDEGIEYLLDAGFNGGSQTSTWYMLLVDNSGFSAFAAADTMASHSGWTEDQTYSEGTRPEWTADAAGSRAVTNSTTVDFSINGTTVIQGIAATTNNTKGGTTGTLFATAAFSSTASVESGDTLKVTYTVSG